MPLDDVRYRVHRTTSGKKVRLAFRGHKVVEAKNIETGATHSPSDFAADRARKRRSLADQVTSMRAAGKFGAPR